MHDHSHHHDNVPMSMEEISALVRYNGSHNAHHAEELHELAHALEDAGNMTAAEKLFLASEKLKEAAGLTLEALSLMKK